jgi:NAD(P)-dependent dehydrogenase (short-subunit alcohol dehydrogenase family)
MKNIIVTGTSRGIGYELALKFANVDTMFSLFPENTSNFIENKNITCLSVDLSNEADLDKVGVLVEFLEKVDAIVHNAVVLC